MRIAKKKIESQHVVDSGTYIKSTTHKLQDTPLTPKTKSPDRSHTSKEPAINGHTKESKTTALDKRQRPYSPEKLATKPATSKPKSPVRPPSPDKKTRTRSPTKTVVSSITPKNKTNRFNEYASAYMKKVGLDDNTKIKSTDVKTKKTNTDIEENKSYEIIRTSTDMSKSFTERTSSKDTIEVIQINGKRSPSPDIKTKRVKSPEYKTPTERLYQRTPSPEFKRNKSDASKPKQETIIKTVYDTEKKIQQKQNMQEEKPSWITNRNLKKITSETRTFSSKKIENDKKIRAPSPSKVITKPIDVITSSYGPGPLDADGRPLFGIKALRNGATNYQGKNNE